MDPCYIRSEPQGEVVNEGYGIGEQEFCTQGIEHIVNAIFPSHDVVMYPHYFVIRDAALRLILIYLGIFPGLTYRRGHFGV